MAVTNLSIKKPLAPIYLLYGTESYIINHLKEKIIELAIKKEEQAFNLGVYDLNEESIDGALEDADTLPFFGDKKVIILENPYFLTGEVKKQKVEHNLDRLSAYLSEPSPMTVMIFVGSFEKLDKRKKIVKQLEKVADVSECVSISDDMMFKWLADEAGKEGAVFTREAHDTLLSLVGPHMAILMNEIKKLALYAGEGGTIDQNMVKLLASRSLESDVFAMVNRIMERKLGEAYQLLADLLKQKEDPIKLTALVTRQIRMAFQTEMYRLEGYTQSQAASRLKLHPYAVKIAWGQGQKLGSERLRKALLYCADMDDALKTGKIEKTVGLQTLFERLASI
ncbi:MAG: DNA polymerase III subunit delta [Tuberibacillus sp.]